MLTNALDLISAVTATVEPKLPLAYAEIILHSESETHDWSNFVGLHKDLYTYAEKFKAKLEDEGGRKLSATSIKDAMRKDYDDDRLTTYDVTVYYPENTNSATAIHALRAVISKHPFASGLLKDLVQVAHALSMPKDYVICESFVK